MPIFATTTDHETKFFLKKKMGMIELLFITSTSTGFLIRSPALNKSVAPRGPRQRPPKTAGLQRRVVVAHDPRASHDAHDPRASRATRTTCATCGMRARCAPKCVTVRLS